jgi:hypothetical protein
MYCRKNEKIFYGSSNPVNNNKSNLSNGSSLFSNFGTNATNGSFIKVAALNKKN